MQGLRSWQLKHDVMFGSRDGDTSAVVAVVVGVVGNVVVDVVVVIGLLSPLSSMSLSFV